MQLRVLGPVEVVHDRSSVTIRGGKPRQLLAFLAMHANRPVPSEQLIDWLWEGSAPPSASTALRVHVGRLRRALEPERGANAPSGRLPATAHGYVLRVEPDELDAERFERLVLLGREANAGGEQVFAVAQLVDALSLWRGDAYQDVRDLNAAATEIARIEELRAVAIEELGVARLAIGDHLALVDDLTAAVHAYPLRERLTGLLMRALYRCGRQADALRAYGELARRLDEELGVQPSPELRSLEEDVLLQRPKLDWALPRVAPAKLSERRVAPRRFVGRRAELAWMLARLDEAGAGGSRFALVRGAAGIGKSTIVTEFAARADRAGAAILRSACVPDGVGLDALAAAVGANAAVATAAAGPRGGTPAPPEDPAAEQVRFLEEITDAVAALPSRPLVLVVEDVHWADRPTLLALRQLLRTPSVERLLVLATCRDDEIGHERAELLARLARRGFGDEITLSGFDERGVRALVRTVAAPDRVELLLAAAPLVHELTGGNPFFIRELLRELEEHTFGGDRQRELAQLLKVIAPPGVGALVDRRIARLSPAAQAVLEAAAVLGRDLSTDMIGAVSGLSPFVALDALEECLAVRLLVDDELDPLQVAFPHALVRNVVYARIDPDRRARLHGAAASAIEARGIAVVTERREEFGRHVCAALPYRDTGQAALCARRNGDDARARFAFDEAAEWYARAIEIERGRGSDAGSIGRLQFALAWAYEADGRVEPAHDMYLAAADSARHAEDAGLLADVALGAAEPWSSGFDTAEGAALLDEALAAIGDADPVRRVRVLNGLATRLYFLDPDREGRIAAEALDIAASLEPPSIATAQLAMHRWYTHDPGAVASRLEFARHACRVALPDAHPDIHLRARRELLADLLQAGCVDEFHRGLDEYEALARERRAPRHTYWAGVLRATQATMRGDLAVAEQLARGAALRGRALDRHATGAQLLQEFVVRYEQGRLNELLGVLQAAPDAQPAYRAGYALAAIAACDTGRPDEGARLTRRALGPDGSKLPRDAFWLAGIALFAGVAAFARDREVVQLLRPLLEPHADQIVVFGVGGAVLGSGHYWLAGLAAAAGEVEAAAAHYREAARVADGLGLPFWLASAQAELAFLEPAAGDALTRSAREIAARHGFGRVLVRTGEGRGPTR
jgi:DNA-binding SARP family transcriptional activator